MAKAMKRRDVEVALREQDCRVLADRGDHTKWGCPCGKHSANIPRHNVISPGVVGSTIKRMGCLTEGWLQ